MQGQKSVGTLPFHALAHVLRRGGALSQLELSTQAEGQGMWVQQADHVSATQSCGQHATSVQAACGHASSASALRASLDLTLWEYYEGCRMRMEECAYVADEHELSGWELIDCLGDGQSSPDSSPAASHTPCVVEATAGPPVFFPQPLPAAMQASAPCTSGVGAGEPWDAGQDPAIGQELCVVQQRPQASQASYAHSTLAMDIEDDDFCPSVGCAPDEP